MEYVLDVSKWRCGGDGKNRLGDGRCLMLNKEGYSCCLGQFAKQVGVKAEHLIGRRSPAHTLDPAPRYDTAFVTADGRDSELSYDCMHVNDDLGTPPAEKVEKLREILEEAGHTLRVIDDNNLLGAT